MQKQNLRNNSCEQGYKRQIVGYDVAFDKSKERIQQLVDNSSKARNYYSDDYSVYEEIC